MKTSGLCLLSTLLLLVSCDMPTSYENQVDDRYEKKAKAYMGLLFDGFYELISCDMPESLTQSEAEKKLAEMHAMFPDEQPTRIDLIGYHWFKATGKPIHRQLVYQYNYPNQWVLVEIAFYELPGDKTQLTQFYATPLKRPLQQIHRFTLKNKSPLHYAFLAGCIFNPLFIGVTLLVCIRTKMRKRKWLWLILIAVGVFTLSFNWTTGEISQDMIKVTDHSFHWKLPFQLLGAGFYKYSTYSPLMLQWAVPFGAIAFWIMRKKLKRPAAVENQTEYPLPDSVPKD